MIGPRLAVLGAGSVALLAQETLPVSDLAKLPVHMACIAVVAYVAIKTMPGIFEKQIAAQQQQQAAHNEQYAKALQVHRESHTELTVALTTKLDDQTKVLQETLRQTGGK